VAHVPCGPYVPCFTLDDADVMVDAAFACPVCLRAGTRVEIEVAGNHPAGSGACRTCGATWALALEPRQLLRLSLDPPCKTLVLLGEPQPAPLVAGDLDEDRA
jgi:hypothetical protein